LNKTELFGFLEEIGARPYKGLSQNFLVDLDVLRKIIALAEIKPGDRVLEIGPGPGSLTKELLAAGVHVFAVEKDRLFAHHLPRLQTADGRLQVRCADILEFNLLTLPTGPFKVVANLPYNITSPILEILCKNASLFSSFTLMVQKEVADRIAAKPSTKAFGSLTLFLQFYARVYDSFLVKPGSFYPSPSVDSTVIRLDTCKSPEIDHEVLFSFIRKAFQQRRKMLTSTLGKEVGIVLEELHLSNKARPEELSLDQWVALVRLLKAGSTSSSE
jgi:16S rRNA (adenine1518-N6/adenine1519-N6)-dimethyltransferase